MTSQEKVGKNRQVNEGGWKAAGFFFQFVRVRWSGILGAGARPNRTDLVTWLCAFCHIVGLLQMNDVVSLFLTICYLSFFIIHVWRRNPCTDSL